ncbi:YjgN family protein [Neptuniibacter sp. QD34_54]|uniref:YjgN family protein n=1 Tax=Neptuniibacter sp. QD34_54 TaxID=3398208 RepID=UPI0039F54D2C
MTQDVAENLSANRKPFQFMGTGGEFFKIWIVNILLSILTLGIYSAWAKVRTNRYFYGNTQLNGDNFEYHATPIQILKGRLIAFAVLVTFVFLDNLNPIFGGITAVVIMFATPWIIWNALKFNARMCSYRNVHFNLQGKLRKAYEIMLWLPLAPVLILGALGGLAYHLGATTEALLGLASVGILAIYLMIPLIQGMFQNFYVNSARFGQGQFKAKISAGFFYWMYLKLLLIALVVIVAAVIVPSIFLGGVTAISALSQGPDLVMSSMNNRIAMILIPLTVVVYVLFGIWSKAYIQVNIRNYTLNQTSLDQVVSFESKMTVWGLFKLQAVNLLLMIVSLGFAKPWVDVRKARYSADSLIAEVEGDLGQYVSDQQAKQSALTDEMGEAFDVDSDLGLAV